MNEQVGSWFFFISGAILCNQTLQIGAISSIWLWASNDLHLQTRLTIRVFQNYVDDRSIYEFADKFLAFFDLLIRA
jgi:hypothetical protein